MKTSRRDGKATPGKSVAKIEIIQNDLEMKVRRPAPIFGGCPEVGKNLPAQEAIPNP